MGSSDLEGQQSLSEAFRRVFQVRWRGDTRCGCTSALLPGTVNSLWQLLLPYHTGRVVMG